MTFEWPILLWTLALVPALLALYVLAQRRRRAYAVRFTNLTLLKEVVGRRPGLRRHLPPLLFVLGLASLLVSLARPSAVIAFPRDESSVVLVIDTSGSMTATDLRPTRMDAAKEAARAFVEALPANSRVALVSFSTRTQVAAPLTTDKASVLAAIRGLRADGGTAIGDGIDTALGVLRQAPEAAGAASAPADGQASGTIVLLSDGASSSGQPPERAAQAARDAGVIVHTVGLGQRGSGARIGGRVPVDLDERTLQSVAQATNGAYFYAAESGDLQRIYSTLGSQVSWREEKTEVTALASALGTVLVVGAGLFSLRWFQALP